MPNTPGDRSISQEAQPQRNIYVISGGKEEGPWDESTVCLLISAGRITRDSVYRVAGDGTTRPISDFDDEVTVRFPRKHHYLFAYQILPRALFAIPKFVANVCSGDPTPHVTWAWDQATQYYTDIEHIASTGLSAEMIAFDRDHVLLFVTLPTPRRNTEAYFAAAIIPRPRFFSRKTGVVRYFILSHSEADESVGLGSEGCVREITADGKNFRSKDFVEPFKPDFVKAIRELCKEEPRGSFCVMQ